MKKKSIKIKYSRRKKSKKITKKNRKINKGGDLFGIGANGVALGNPGIPCEDDDIQKRDSFISKIEKDESGTVEKESNAGDLLRKKNIQNVNEYFIIPFAKCKVDEKYLNDGIYTPEWYSGFSKKDIVGKPMLLSNKAIGTIEDVFKNKPKNVVSNISILLNIAKGIQLLQNNNLIHNDIKPSNCVVHENKGKIIDLADLRDMGGNNMLGMPYNFFYFSWPSIMVYTYFYHNVNNDKPVINMNIDSLRRLYNKSSKSSIDDDINMNDEHIRYLEEFISKPFDYIFKHNDDFDFLINNYKEELIRQKTFGITNIIYRPGPEQIVIDFFKDNFDKNEKYSDEVKSEINKNVNTYLEECTSIVQNNGKIDLLKRCDIYSFGLMILRIIFLYIKGNNFDRTQNFESFLFKLYEIAFYCCNQIQTCPDINSIVEYLDLLIEFAKKINLQNISDETLYDINIKNKNPDDNHIKRKRGDNVFIKIQDSINKKKIKIN
jgi:serine/threonine protein kinase